MNDKPGATVPRQESPADFGLWYLGIDLGTGSCKSIAVTPAGSILGMGVGEYEGEGTQEKWQEQDPEALVAGLVRSVRETIAAAGVTPAACAGLSVGGALHSLLALDDADRPLTGVITWADGRAATQAAALRRQPVGQMLYQQTGCPVHGMYPLYKIIWLRQERPAIFAAAARFISAKSYIVSRLTGHSFVDYCLAAGSGLLNTHTLRWNPLSLSLAGIDEGQLFTPASPTTILRGLDVDLAAQMGISADTPLVLGSADAANSSIGAGAVAPGIATCMLGTSGAFRVISRQPVLDDEGRVWCYALDQDHWLVGGAINNGGIAFSWLRDLLNERLPENVHHSFSDLLAAAEQAAPGADGMLCLPFFAGERSPNWNLDARAVFFGMTLEHGVAELARSLLEGIAFRIRSVSEMLAAAGVDVREIRASGGFTHSPFWVGLMATVLQQELLVPAVGETSALGAAFWAMFATGHRSELAQAERLVVSGERYQPNRARAALYDRLYALFSQLYFRLEEPFAQAAALQQELAHGPELGNGT